MCVFLCNFPIKICNWCYHPLTQLPQMVVLMLGWSPTKSVLAYHLTLTYISGFLISGPSPSAIMGYDAFYGSLHCHTVAYRIIINVSDFCICENLVA